MCVRHEGVQKLLKWHCAKLHQVRCFNICACSTPRQSAADSPRGGRVGVDTGWRRIFCTAHRSKHHTRVFSSNKTSTNASRALSIDAGQLAGGEAVCQWPASGNTSCWRRADYRGASLHVYLHLHLHLHPHLHLHLPFLHLCPGLPCRRTTSRVRPLGALVCTGSKVKWMHHVH